MKTDFHDLHYRCSSAFKSTNLLTNISQITGIYPSSP
uniref:Uncharacterized protein n=1 Tax=Anguilla anguilla TaxID=7936 RepID=A0A0E9PHM8_ANGAN